MPFKGYAVSVRGASHEDAGEPCQDSARVYTGEGLAIAAVSDGHGSAKHFRSAAGSEMATRVAIRSLCDFCEKNGGIDGLFDPSGAGVRLCGTTAESADAGSPENAARRIAANIICGWNSEIAAHMAFAPLNDTEQKISQGFGGIPAEVMYGATLIAAAVTERGVFGLQIGDGCFNSSEGGVMGCPMPDDAKLMGNLTTSLCDSDAIGSFRWFYRSGAPEGVMLSSDGLIGSFRNESDFLSFGGRVLGAISDGTAASLAEHLRRRSRSGSRDDISIAALVAYDNRKE